MESEGIALMVATWLIHGPLEGFGLGVVVGVSMAMEVAPKKWMVYIDLYSGKAHRSKWMM